MIDIANPEDGHDENLEVFLRGLREILAKADSTTADSEEILAELNAWAKTLSRPDSER